MTTPEPVAANVCHYPHHKVGGVSAYGQPLECSKCGGPSICGPFAHACPKCDRFQFERCGLCGKPRVDCCC
jgi:hypothetical protein